MVWVRRGLGGSQRVVGVAEQVDFDGQGVAVADGGAVEMFVKAPPVGSARLRPRDLQAASRRGMRHQPAQTPPRRGYPVRQACRALPSHHLHRRDQRMAVIDFDTDPSRRGSAWDAPRRTRCPRGRQEPSKTRHRSARCPPAGHQGQGCARSRPPARPDRGSGQGGGDSWSTLRGGGSAGWCPTASAVWRQSGRPRATRTSRSCWSAVRPPRAGLEQAGPGRPVRPTETPVERSRASAAG